LKFDFSTINASANLTVANQNLITRLNSSIEKFYQTYAAYLGEDVADLCQNIDSNCPNTNLDECARLVQNALSRARKQKNEQLAGIQGIYVLVDEHDAFANNYLESLNPAEPYKTTLENIAVERTFRSFWYTVKSLGSQGCIQKVFITGISPLSLSAFGSSFNVTRDLSFHQDLAGLCGLTYSDLEDVLREIENCEAPNHLSEMTKSFNGYHFCRNKKVGTVYNTEMCLAYFQSIVDGGDLETKDPPNSEMSRQFLKQFGTSAPLITDLEKALQYDEGGNFPPLEYYELKQDFTLQDLVC
jgi:Predicted AAA-ATPase